MSFPFGDFKQDNPDYDKPFQEESSGFASFTKLPRETRIEDSRDSLIFNVADVEVEKEPLTVAENHVDFLKKKIGAKYIEDCNYQIRYLKYSNTNGLVDAIHLAFSLHYPLVLTPDCIWSTIMQGLAIHINENSEKLRSYFVPHKGKKKITVVRDSFVRHSGRNDWSTVFPEFSQKIKDIIGENTHDLIMNDYSTTGKIERIVSEITLMDSMQQYFEYSVQTSCGIPTITLTGQIEDWLKIKKKLAYLSQISAKNGFGLESWLNHLMPVVNNICLTRIDKKVDLTFWNSMYKKNNGSGGPYISGWITVLYPYLKTSNGYRKNEMLDWNKEREFGGLKTEDIPNGLSRTKFDWDYFGTIYPMSFVGGIVGVSQNPNTMSVKPEFGWAVIE